ncbi:MAG: cysteine desulfhydrase, partial [Alishewanella aestuarii]
MASLPTATYHWQHLPIPLVQDNTPQLWICTLQAPVAEVAGNKWLKLHSAIQQRKPGQGMLSFGGAFSNHLIALAAAGQHYHFPTIGLVRTEQLDTHNPTLRRCRELGMQLIA